MMIAGSWFAPMAQRSTMTACAGQKPSIANLWDYPSEEGKVRTADAIRMLDQDERAVFTTGDLRAIFPERSEKTFTGGLSRLVAGGVLTRAARGVYVKQRTGDLAATPYLLEMIAVALRQGHACYLSLLTALNHYSLISQMTWSITVMTTGRKGRFDTPFGTIAFTHTERSAGEIEAGTVDVGQPLRWARPFTALEDLRRTRRNLELVDIDPDELELIHEEMGLPPITEEEQRQLRWWQQLPWAEPWRPVAVGAR